MSKLQELITKYKGDYVLVLNEYLSSSEYKEYQKRIDSEAISIIQEDKKEENRWIEEERLKRRLNPKKYRQDRRMVKKLEEKMEKNNKEQDKKWEKLEKFGFDTNSLLKTHDFRFAQNYIKNIFSKKQFVKKVQKIREKYQIPSGGLVEGGDWPAILVTSQGWSGFLSDCEKLSKKYYLLSSSTGISDKIVWSFVLRNKLFFDDGEMGIDFSVNDLPNYCKFVDLADKQYYFFPPDDIDEDEYYTDNKEELFLFPIAIKISPAATEKTILDFVAKIYKTIIRPHQLYYGGENHPLNEKRKRRKGARDRFICENRHLSRKEIAILVREKFGETLDVGTVGKIISMNK